MANSPKKSLLNPPIEHSIAAMPVEEDKPLVEQDTYLYPTERGKPAAASKTASAQTNAQQAHEEEPRMRRKPRIVVEETPIRGFLRIRGSNAG